MSMEWPIDGLEYLGQCPVCGSKLREIQYSNLLDHLYGAPGSWTLFRCIACEVRYLDPRPNFQTIGLAYSNYYTHENGSPERQRNNILANIKLSLKNGYLNSVWQASLQPSSPSIARLITKVHPKWMGLYERLALRDLPKLSGGKLLDIGCGSGRFLMLAKQVGWSVHGIDFDKKAIDAAKANEIDARVGGVELFDGQHGLFDAITLSHVIEHVHEPRKMLDACWRLLKQGGTFWIESPNFDSVGRKLFGRNWRGLEAPRHLVLFNTTNMKNTLTEVGFTNIQHAGWMPQHKLMYQASKNLKNGETVSARNLTLPEEIAIMVADMKLRRNEPSREFFTYICKK